MMEMILQHKYEIVSRDKKRMNSQVSLGTSNDYNQALKLKEKYRGILPNTHHIYLIARDSERRGK